MGVINSVSSTTIYSSQSNKPTYTDGYYTREGIIDLYNKSKEKGAHYLLICWDYFDFTDQWQFKIFAYSKPEMEEQKKANTVGGYYSVARVYDLNIPIEEQL